MFGGNEMENKNIEEEINSRIEDCPWRDDKWCDRYEGCKIPCDGACSWVVDYARLKEIKEKHKS